MNPLNNSNEFEQYIIQQLSQLDEVPSEKVWESLESKWAKNRKYSASAIAFLGLFPITTIAVVIFLLQDTSSQQVLAPFNTEISSSCDEQEDCLEKFYLASANHQIPDQQIAISYGLGSRNRDTRNHSITTTNLPSPSHESVPIFDKTDSESGSETHEETLVVQKNTRPFIQETDSTDGPDFEKKKSIKKRKKGNDWDYQIGVRLSAADFYNKIIRRANPYTDIYHIEGIGEWAISHRLRVNSGIVWQRIASDFEQQKTSRDFINGTVQSLGIAVDTQQVQAINLRDAENQLMIPLDFLFFITPQDPNTQVWVGVGLRQQVWTRYKEVYSLNMEDGSTLVEILSQNNVSFLYRDFRFMVGAEQRLTTALRLRVNGFITLQKGILSVGSLRRQYGGSVSLFWASPRGPLRWRKNTKSRF